MAAAGDLSLNAWAVLTVLVDDGPSHGFAISQTLGKGTVVGQVWAVPRPLVYRALDQLVAAGLARPEPQEPGSGGPSRRPFRVTPTGRKAVRRWRVEPVVHLRDVRAELMLKLVLSERAGRDITPLLEAQLDQFAPLRAADPPRPEGAGDAGHVVAVWRQELAEAVDRSLRTLLAERATVGGPRPPSPG